MLVVCDTTPLNYLIQIQLVELIPRLFESACMPEAVFRELSHPRAPSEVRDWIAHIPDWILVRPAGPVHDSALLELHPGEREAVVLATSLRAQFLLTDDYKARTVLVNGALRP